MVVFGVTLMNDSVLLSPHKYVPPSKFETAFNSTVSPKQMMVSSMLMFGIGFTVITALSIAKHPFNIYST